MVDFVVFTRGASVKGTDGKNKNDWDDGDKDVTGDLEAETTSSSSETFKPSEEETFPVTFVV